MITEKTKLILRLVEEQKITAEEALLLITPEIDIKEFQVPSNEPYVQPWIVPYPIYPSAAPWWQSPFIVTSVTA